MAYYAWQFSAVLIMHGLHGNPSYAMAIHPHPHVNCWTLAVTWPLSTVNRAAMGACLQQ
jgi:hypothetical protein